MTKPNQAKKDTNKVPAEKPADNLARIEELLAKTIEACHEIRDSVDRLAQKFSGGY